MGEEAERPSSRIITRDEHVKALLLSVEGMSRTSSPILITGETGVGKDLFARAIHGLSGRRGDFIPVNVAGIDDALFADLLFGHRRGAFTGADQPLKGLLERAAGGTLFLDEIGDLSALSQTKLLRLLESGEYFPVGADMAYLSDARIVVATNRDIELMVERDMFRKDLYYRLHVHHITVPPLRERRGDIPLLLEHFLLEAARELGKKPPTVPPGLVPILEAHSFPGNVRELRAAVINAMSGHSGGVLSLEPFRSLLSDGKTAAGDPPYAIAFGARLPTIKQATDALVSEALRRSGNNQSTAARLLGISQQALSSRLRNQATRREKMDFRSA